MHGNAARVTEIEAGVERMIIPIDESGWRDNRACPPWRVSSHDFRTGGPSLQVNNRPRIDELGKQKPDRIDRILQNGDTKCSLIESSFLVTFCLQPSPEKLNRRQRR